MAEMNATLEIDLGHHRGSRRSRSRSRSRSPKREKDYAEVHDLPPYSNERVEVVQPRRTEVVVAANDNQGQIKTQPSRPPKRQKGEPCLTMKDMSDRDPKRIADDVRVTFEDIIAEPDQTMFSFDQVWTTSILTYTETKKWVYRVITLILGVPVSIIWGIVFAVISFLASWICVPCLKCYRVQVLCCRRFYEITFLAFLEPLILTLSKFFYNIRVQVIHSNG